MPGLAFQGPPPAPNKVFKTDGNSEPDWRDDVAADVNPAGTSIASALSGKAPSTHSHAIADVSGLQTALDNRLALWGALTGTTPSLTFTDREQRQTHTLSGNTTYSFSGYAQGRVIELFIEGDPAVERTIAFTGIPDGAWLEGKPLSVKVGKKMKCRFECTNGSNTGVFATYGTAT